MTVDTLSLVDKISLRSWAKAQPIEYTSFNPKYLNKFISEFLNAGDVWAGYQPIQNEPSINWTELSALGIDLCFPKINGQDLQFFRSTTFTTGVHGLSEPESNEEVSKDSIKGLFIPGLAFDSRGQRLGRGKAFYDRYLNDFKGLKVGLTFSQFFIHGSIPNDSWDVAMDFVVTEKFIFQPLISKR